MVSPKLHYIGPTGKISCKSIHKFLSYIYSLWSKPDFIWMIHINIGSADGPSLQCCSFDLILRVITSLYHKFILRPYHKQSFVCGDCLYSSYVKGLGLGVFHISESFVIFLSTVPSQQVDIKLSIFIVPDFII